MIKGSHMINTIPGRRKENREERRTLFRRVKGKKIKGITWVGFNNTFDKQEPYVKSK